MWIFHFITCFKSCFEIKGAEAICIPFLTGYSLKVCRIASASIIGSDFVDNSSIRSMNINYEPLLKVSSLENQTDTCMKAELQTGKNETVDQNPY